MTPVLHDAWWRLATQHHPRTVPDVLASRALQAGSLVYGAAVAVRNAAYDRGWVRQVALPCRVISIGNLTVGGTGKTACTELIAAKLTALGRRVAVLSRGYGGSKRPYGLRWEAGRLMIDGAAATARDGLADEPQVLARRLDGMPVLVGRRRDRTGAVACRQFGAEAVVLDDGFQHRRLRRDCDIVLVHARMPLGGWALLPRGPMREPLASLKRADIILVTKADEALPTVSALGERLRAVNPRAAFAMAAHEPDHLQDALTGAAEAPQRLDGLRVGLLSSIGDPEGFEATVERLHASVVWHERFPDHHRYRPQDWAAVTRRGGASRIDAVVTTEKDWVRLQPAAMDGGRSPVPLWVLAIRMTILSGEQELDDRLARLWVR